MSLVFTVFMASLTARSSAAAGPAGPAAPLATWAARPFVGIEQGRCCFASQGGQVQLAAARCRRQHLCFKVISPAAGRAWPGRGPRKPAPGPGIYYNTVGPMCCSHPLEFLGLCAVLCWTEMLGTGWGLQQPTCQRPPIGTNLASFLPPPLHFAHANLTGTSSQSDPPSIVVPSCKLWAYMLSLPSTARRAGCRRLHGGLGLSTSPLIPTYLPKTAGLPPPAMAAGMRRMWEMPGGECFRSADDNLGWKGLAWGQLMWMQGKGRCSAPRPPAPACAARAPSLTRLAAAVFGPFVHTRLQHTTSAHAASTLVWSGTGLGKRSRSKEEAHAGPVGAPGASGRPAARPAGRHTEGGTRCFFPFFAKGIKFVIITTGGRRESCFVHDSNESRFRH